MKSPLETMCEMHQADRAAHEYDSSMLEAAEESLREHMARIKELEAALAQPAQKPVALELEEYDASLLSDYGGGNVEWWQDYIRAELGRAYEHYQSQATTPPLPVQRQPLTDEEIDAISLRDGGVTYRQLARAVEAAHNIGTKP